MRQQAPMIPRIARYIVLAMAMVFATGTVSADSRSDARTHYQAGVKFYNGGDYKSAIREFSAAQQLAPADLNNYNLALCYDKLGDPEPAIQYYRAYLDKQPTTDKRAEIEASMNRLESASKSVAAKKAEEARKIEEAKKAEELARVQADEARKAEDAKRADEARRAEEARKPAMPPEQIGPGTVSVGASGPPPGPGAGPGPAIGGGSTGTPGSGMPVSTGDAQLDRVQQIDVGSVRDQRGGGANSGTSDPRGGPATSANPRVAESAGMPPDGAPMQGDPNPPRATPVYKKWWFWAVVAVSAYVVYAIASEDSAQAGNGNVRGRELPPMLPKMQDAGGLTLMRW